MFAQTTKRARNKSFLRSFFSKKRPPHARRRFRLYCNILFDICKEKNGGKSKKMKITWIGQAGLLIESAKATVIIDPYLSDSVGAVNPEKHRRVPVDESLFDIEPNMILFTHNHLDHYDPESAERYLAKSTPKTVLCPSSVWSEARKNGGNNNYVRFDVGTEWSEYGLRFRAVRAVHSDDFAIGFVIEETATGKKIYVTGDTLYNADIFPTLPSDLFAVLLPVNGMGNNMNAEDAARFAKATGARYAVPLHIGLFDALTPDIFRADNAVIPEFYKEIVFPEK